MELTFESAFSTGGMVGNASYILLILSMAMRDMFWLRILAIFSGLTGIAYDAFWLSNPVGIFWESLFTLTNLVQWLWLVYEKRKQRLTGAESLLKSRLFAGLSDSEFRQLLDHAEYEQFPLGKVIIHQGQIVSALYLINSGQVEIAVNGNPVSCCLDGDYLGEIAYLTGTQATATATASSDVELIRFDRTALAGLIKNSEALGARINTMISENLAKKLVVQSRV